MTSQGIRRIWKFTSSRYGWTLILAAAVLSILPMAFVGIYQGNDLPQHAQFANTFNHQIEMHDLNLSWSSEENLGYGGTGVRFYPPAVPFMWAFLRSLTGDWHSAVCLLFLFFTAAGSIGVYFFAREFVDPGYAVISGLIFTVMPYHLFDIYNASVYAEFAGCSILPFCFLFLERTVRKGRLTDVLGLGLSYSLLLLTHLPSSVIGSIALGVYGLTLLVNVGNWRRLALLISAVALGLASSSFFWIKILTEGKWIRITRMLTNHAEFDFQFNFLITSSWFDQRNLWFLNSMWLLLFLIGVGSLSIIWKSSVVGRKTLIPLFTTFFLSLLMCTGLSAPMWGAIPRLSEVQFPWRWLTISSVFVPLIISEILSLSGENRVHGTRLGQWFESVSAMGLLGILILIAVGFQMNFVPRSTFDTWVSEQNRSIGPEWFWTPLTSPEVFETQERVTSSGRTVDLRSWEPLKRTFHVGDGGQAIARIATLYYPYWNAEIDTLPAETLADSNGAIEIILPDHACDVTLYFQEPPLVRAAIVVSILSWIISMCVLCMSLFRKRSLTLTST